MKELHGFIYDAKLRRYYKKNSQNGGTLLETPISYKPTNMFPEYLIEWSLCNEDFAFSLLKLRLCINREMLSISTLGVNMAKISNDMVVLNDRAISAIHCISNIWCTDSVSIFSFGNELGDFRKTAIYIDQECRELDGLSLHFIQFQQHNFLILSDDTMVDIDSSWRWSFKNHVLSCCTSESYFYVSTMGSKLYMFGKNGQKIQLIRTFNLYANILCSIDDLSIVYSDQENSLFVFDRRSSKPTKIATLPGDKLTGLMWSKFNQVLLAIAQRKIFFYRLCHPAPVFSISSNVDVRVCLCNESIFILSKHQRS